MRPRRKSRRRGTLALALAALAALGAAAVGAAGCDAVHHLLPGDAGLDGGFVGTFDSDMDTISDAEEGRAERRDTDGDGVPDYLDTDSDNDTLPDAFEAGDRNISTPPRDADRDGRPDYLDTDSDDNGIPDEREGEGDFDEDGIPDYADLDDDNDFARDVDELGGLLEPFVDTDRDGFPNFHDQDSDNDTILDGDEFNADTDRDGLFDNEDSDSDNDGLPDSVEAGDEDLFSQPIDTDGDHIADFRDPDSDNDGLADGFEVEHNSDPLAADTDGDGVNDLIEHAAGTDPRDRADSPLTRGDFVFTVDYMRPPSPARDTLELRTHIQLADIYFFFDASASMGGEQDGLAAGVTRILGDLTCAGSGMRCRNDVDCESGQICSLSGTCIEDPARSSCVASPWSGAGYYGALLGGGLTVVNQLGVQSDPVATRSAIGRIPADGDLGPLFDAAWSVADPAASSLLGELGCVSGRPGRLGCPGFREEAVRILIGFTDEGSAGSRGDALAGAASAGTVGDSLRDQGVTFIGVWSAGTGGGGRQDLVDLATESGSFDRAGAPLVFDASSSGAGIDAVVTDAINEIVARVPLRVTIEAADAVGDAGDALPFIDHLEVNVGGGRCSAVSATEDTDGDAHDDTFPRLLPGTPVCWDVVPAMNTHVPRLVNEPQVFKARFTVLGDGSPLDSRVVYFLVPPEIVIPIGPP